MKEKTDHEPTALKLEGGRMILVESIADNTVKVENGNLVISVKAIKNWIEIGMFKDFLSALEEIIITLAEPTG